MNSVEGLLQARREIEAAYKKDVEAVDYLLSRMGYSKPSVGYVNGLGQARSVRTPDAPIKAGSLRDWTNRAFLANPSNSLTAPLIYDLAISEGATFATTRDKTIQALSGVLRAMTREGLLRVIEQGSGRRASSYQMMGSSTPNIEAPAEAEATM